MRGGGEGQTERESEGGREERERDGWMDGWTETQRETDRPTDRQTDRQTERCHTIRPKRKCNCFQKKTHISSCTPSSSSVAPGGGKFVY